VKAGVEVAVPRGASERAGYTRRVANLNPSHRKPHIMRRNLHVLALALACVGVARPRAQAIESVGVRAQGMGGAFVAVADDSSATWWNPGALAAGPFGDVAISRSVRRERADPAPSEQAPLDRAPLDQTVSFTLSTPPFGVSVQRVHGTQAVRHDSIAGGSGGREDALTGIVTRSIDATALGVTLVQTIAPGVHAGGTVKYLRGTARGDAESPSASTLGDSRTVGAQHRVDLDVGVLATAGPVRIGGVIRNVAQSSFDVGDDGGGASGERGRVTLPRQFRVGVAFAPASRPLVVAVDADLRGFVGAAGARRVVALGAERWWRGRRVGVRGGGRFNQVGRRERSATGGLSVALRPGAYVEGHVVGGGSIDERGWGVGARVTF
jgi:hypothetical protein